MQNNGVIQIQGQTLAVISTEEQASSICIVVYVKKHCATCEYADQVVDTICAYPFAQWANLVAGFLYTFTW